jgi:hypothetical protein
MAVAFDGVDHALELAQKRHVVEDAHEIGFGKVFLFLLDRFVILIDRDILKMDHARLSQFGGIDK